VTTTRRTALAAALLAAGSLAAPAARAQGTTATADEPTRPTGLAVLTGTVAPIYQRWSFGDPIVQDSGRVTTVSQLAVPFSLRFPLSERWSGDVSGAVARSTVEGDSQQWSLGGLTDLRLRAVGRLRGDNLLLTVGVNLPTGQVELDGDELRALQFVAAPTLGMAVPVFGGGLGGTVGLVAAGQAAGGWAYALGASLEQRTRFTAAELTVAGNSTATDVRPGQAVHLSFGADGLVAGGRLSLFAIGDLFGDDQLRVRTSPFTAEESSYRLGPAVTSGARYEFPTTRLRSLTAAVTNRYRTKYKDADGHPVDGSSGDAFDATVSAVTGTVDRPGLLLALRGRFDTGLASDDRLVSAASRIFGATVGVAIPRGRYTATPSLRASFGTIDLGPTSTSARELALAFTLAAR
jgi:hypothetical protein